MELTAFPNTPLILFLRFEGASEKDLRFVMQEGKFDLRMGQGHMIKLVDNVSQFGLVAFQEFPSGRDIEEKISYLEIRTFGGLHGLHGFLF